MAVVNGRWFIPVAFVAFVLLIVALRAYLLSGEDLPRLSNARPQSEMPAAIDGPQRRTTGRTLPSGHPRVDGRRSAPAIRRTARRLSRRQLVDTLARRLDDAAVRFRSNLDGSAFIQSVRGCADLLAGDHRAAVEHFDRALAKRPDDVPLLSAKAAALVSLRRFDEAADFYAKAIQLAPNDTHARYNYGTLLYRQARFTEAVEQFRELVRVDPNHARGQYNLATLAQRAGRISEARDAWLAFTHLQPDVAGAWFNLGVVWMDFDRPHQAAACFSRFAALSPEDPDGWLNLSLAQTAAGCLHAALDALTTADGLAPCDPTIMRRLAELHALLADEDGEHADEHWELAAWIEEQLEPPGDGDRTASAVAAGRTED